MGSQRPSYFLVYSCITLISASIVIRPSGPCLCVSPPVLTRTPITKLRTYFSLAWPHLNQLYLQRHFLDQEEHLNLSTVSEWAIPASHSAEPWEGTHEKELQRWESGWVIGLRFKSCLIWGSFEGKGKKCWDLWDTPPQKKTKEWEEEPKTNTGAMSHAFIGLFVRLVFSVLF